MATVHAKPVIEKDVWEIFLAGHPEADFLQSWYWGDFHEQLDHRIKRYGFYKDDTLVGICQAVVEPAKRGRHLVVAGGPIIDWNDPDVVSCWATTLKRAAKEEKAIFVRVRPQLLDTPANRQLFRHHGLRRAPMHVTADLTSQLDLTKTNEELKQAMRKGTRYDLNRGHKLGIQVEATTDERFLEEFCDLQLATAKRQHFIPFSKRFLTEQFRAFARANKVVMYRSTYEGQLLAMAFVIFYGSEAAYHYGASTDLVRKYPGSYVVQWEAIQEGRRRGCTRYNFWGVTGHGQTNHRYYGVSVFKRGFGGEDVAYLKAHDLVVDPLRYPLTFAFETARRKLRKL